MGRSVVHSQADSCCLWYNHLLLMNDKHSNPHRHPSGNKKLFPSRNLTHRTKSTFPHAGQTENLAVDVHRLLNRPLGQLWWVA